MSLDYKYELGDFVSKRMPDKLFQSSEREFMVVARFIIKHDEWGELPYYHVVDLEGNLRSFFEFSLISEAELFSERLCGL